MLPFQPAKAVNPFSPLTICLLLCSGWLVSCQNTTEKPAVPAAAGDPHQKMLEILAGVKQKMHNPQNTYSAEAKLEQVNSMLPTVPAGGQQLQLKFKKAMLLLEYGDENAAVALFEEVFKLSQGQQAKTRVQVQLALGLAYLRQAERNNCVNGHMVESCIMPIQGSGIHQDKAPSRKAIQAFEGVLKDDPANLDAQWLLNIAYMTVGEYPAKVPAPWLIPGLDAKGGHPLKPFTDIAPDLKLDTRNRAGGIIVDDFNNDGYLDIVNSAWGLDDPLHFFQNNGDGTFTDRSGASRLGQITGGLSLSHADYNNDGFLDILVLRGAWQGQTGFGEQPNSLIRNNGDGTFTDVTTAAGVLSFCPTQAATWNDFNNDGWIDLFIANETLPNDRQYPSELYLNNKNGTFTNAVTANSAFNVIAFAKGVTSGDYDNDGWADIFISTLSGQKVLLRNKGVAAPGVDFEVASAVAGLDKDISPTFPTWFFDYDNDGWLDIFICNYNFDRPLSYNSAKEALHPSGDKAGKITLYHNNGNGTFSNATPSMNLNQTVYGMGANFGDIDNDGWLDMYIGTGNPSYLSVIPNKLYKNIGGKNFADVTGSARVGNLQKGHGVAFADLNNNGDQDIFCDLGGAFRGDAYYTSFYLNPGQNLNNWICLQLEGTTSNRAAIGAKVTVKFTENGVRRMVYREVNSGGSFGASPFRREIGIGQATMIDEIEINWPASGTQQVFKNVKPNQFLKIKEKQDGYEPSAPKTIVFRKADGSIPMCAPAR